MVGSLYCHLRSFRDHFGYSQSDLATYLGCSKNAISDFERGKYLPNAVLISRMLDLFDCHFFDLFEPMSDLDDRS